MEKACPLLVPLVEEGWVDHPVTAEVVRIYLTELLQQAQESDLDPDTLVLGCTHFPMLADAIRRAVGPEVRIVDSAATTAASVDVQLRKAGLARTAGAPGSVRLLATDGCERFARVGSRFLARLIAADQVELVDL